MKSNVSETICLQKENLRVWSAGAVCSHAWTASLLNNKASENNNQSPEKQIAFQTKSVSAVAGVAQDGN